MGSLNHILILLFFYYSNAYNHFIGKELDLKIVIPKAAYSYIHYSYFINIDICNYEKNDSYIIEGSPEQIHNISEYYYQTYQTSSNNTVINIKGTDLKFIDYGVYTSTCSQNLEDNFTITSDDNKYKIRVNNECNPTFNLYIIKDDSSDFINLCNIYNKKNIIYEQEFPFANGKERTLEFELDSKTEKGNYKVVLIADINSMLFKYKAQFINVNSKSKISTVIYVVAIGLFIIIVAIMTFFLTYNPNRQITSTDIDHIKGEEYYDKIY